MQLKDAMEKARDNDGVVINCAVEMALDEHRRVMFPKLLEALERTVDNFDIGERSTLHEIIAEANEVQI